MESQEHLKPLSYAEQSRNFIQLHSVSEGIKKDKSQYGDSHLVSTIDNTKPKPTRQDFEELFDKLYNGGRRQTPPKLLKETKKLDKYITAK